MRAVAVSLSLALIASGASAQPAPEDDNPPPAEAGVPASPQDDDAAPREGGASDPDTAPVGDAPSETPRGEGSDQGEERRPTAQSEVLSAPSTPRSEPLVEPLEDAPWREERDGGPRYPGYVIAGAITLGAGVALGVGTVAAVSQGDDRGALGMGALATIGLTTGVPLVLLGATPEYPRDSEVAYAGIALATSGALGFGLGGTLWAARAGEATRLGNKREKAEAAGEPTEPFADPQHDYLAPVILMGAGGAALVAGVITWAIGAATDDEEDEEAAAAELLVSPTSIGVRGTF